MRSRSGVESVNKKSKESHAIFAASPVFETRVGCRWRREECGGITGLEFEAFRLKIIAK